jgi:uncharacterized membrane protein
MFYAALKLIHLLSVIVWIGGMVFSHFFLRPALGELNPPVKARLMAAVLSRFLNAVLVLSTLTVASGVWMIGRVAKQTVQAGLPFNMPVEWWVMSVLGVFMWLVFGHIRFVLYRRLRLAVDGLDWSVANHVLVQIRHWVLFNLGLGLIVVAVVVIGTSS